MGTPSQDRPEEELPYIVELWHDGPVDEVERVLGKATNLKLAAAILKSAESEYPQRRLSLRKGAEVISETKPPVPSPI